MKEKAEAFLSPCSPCMFGVGAGDTHTYLPSPNPLHPHLPPTTPPHPLLMYTCPLQQCDISKLPPSEFHNAGLVSVTHMDLYGHLISMLLYWENSNSNKLKVFGARGRASYTVLCFVSTVITAAIITISLVPWMWLFCCTCLFFTQHIVLTCYPSSLAT